MKYFNFIFHGSLLIFLFSYFINNISYFPSHISYFFSLFNISPKMEFTDIGYSYLAPLLLLLIIFLKREDAVYCKAILTAANVSLLFFFVVACREYYSLYQLAEHFGFNVSISGLIKLLSTNILVVFRSIISLLLPFCFLFKKLSGSIFLSLLMIGLLWWDAIFAIFTHQEFHFPGYNCTPLLFPILRYFSMLVGMYSFLWLIKRLNLAKKG